MNNDQLTPGPWRWKFSGNAGNYFLYGNDGKGPITSSSPLSADGRLKQAAPALLAACEEALGWIDSIYPPDVFTGESGDEGAVEIVRIREQARAAIAAAKVDD